jgi:hypothetical protein
LDVLDNKLSRPGTEQNTSLGEPTIFKPLLLSLLDFMSGKNGGESGMRKRNFEVFLLVFG